MLSREFTKKEKALLVLCLALALGVFYYQFIYKGVKQRIASYATDELESEIETEQLRASKIREMERVIEEKEAEGASVGELKVYNNLANEISLIGDIMEKKAEKVSLTWETPVLSGTTVRRGVSVAFTTTRYAYMKEILEAFHNCEYRCLLKDLTISDNSSATRSVVARVGGKMTKLTTPNTRRGIRNSSKLSVSFKATFLETSEGAASTEGLVVEKSSNKNGEGTLASRAKAYAD